MGKKMMGERGEYPRFKLLLNKHLGIQERSAKWLADKLELNASTVTKWLNEEARPGKADTVDKIAKILGLTQEQWRELLIAADYLDPTESYLRQHSAQEKTEVLPSLSEANLGTSDQESEITHTAIPAIDTEEGSLVLVKSSTAEESPNETLESSTEEMSGESPTGFVPDVQETSVTPPSDLELGQVAQESETSDAISFSINADEVNAETSFTEHSLIEERPQETPESSTKKAGGEPSELITEEIREQLILAGYGSEPTSDQYSFETITKEILSKSPSSLQVDDYISRLSEIIRLKPDYAEVILLRGTLYSRIRDYERAIVDLNRAEDLVLNVPELARTLADIWVSRSLVREHQGMIDAAIDELTKTIEAYPNRPRPYFERGRIRLTQKSQYNGRWDFSNHSRRYGREFWWERPYGGIRDDFYKATKLDPLFLNAEFELGRLHNFIGESGSAIGNLGYVIRNRPKVEFGPSLDVAYYWLGNIYNDQLKPPIYFYERISEFQKLAIENYSEAIRLNPNFVQAYYERGNVYTILKKYEEAIVDYRNASEIDPDFGKVKLLHKRLSGGDWKGAGSDMLGYIIENLRETLFRGKLW